MSNTLITHTFILDSADRDLDQYPVTNDYRTRTAAAAPGKLVV